MPMGPLEAGHPVCAWSRVVIDELVESFLAR